MSSNVAPAITIRRRVHAPHTGLQGGGLDQQQRPYTAESVLPDRAARQRADHAAQFAFASTTDPAHFPPAPVAAMPATVPVTPGQMIVLRPRSQAASGTRPGTGLSMGQPRDESKEPHLDADQPRGTSPPRTFTVRPHSRLNRAVTPRIDTHRRERSYTAELAQTLERSDQLPAAVAMPGPSVAQLSAKIQQVSIMMLARPPSPDPANASPLMPQTGSLRKHRRALLGTRGTTAHVANLNHATASGSGTRGSVLLRTDHLAELVQRSKTDISGDADSSSFRNSFLFGSNHEAAEAAEQLKREVSSEDDSTDDEVSDDIRQELVNGVGFSMRREADAPVLHPASKQLVRLDPAVIAADHYSLHAHLTTHAPIIASQDLGVVEHWLTEMAVKFSRKMEGEQSFNHTAGTYISATNPDGGSQQASNMATDTAGDYQSPLDKMGIGRRLLEKAGMAGDLTDRCYIGFFTYSIGFYDCILHMIRHVSQRKKLMSGIWKAYLANLETCEPDIYDWVIECVRTENARREDLKRQEHQHRCQLLKAHTKHLKKKVRLMQVNDHALKELESTEQQSIRNLGSNLREMQHAHEMSMEAKANINSAIAERTMNSFEMESTVQHQRDRMVALLQARKQIHVDLVVLRKQLADLHAAVATEKAKKNKLQIQHDETQTSIEKLELDVHRQETDLKQLITTAHSSRKLKAEEEARVRELEDITIAQDLFMAHLASKGLHADLSSEAQRAALALFQLDAARLRSTRTPAQAREAAAAALALTAASLSDQVPGFDPTTGEMTPEEMERRGLNSQVTEMRTLIIESGTKTRELETQRQILIEEIAAEKISLTEHTRKVDDVRAQASVLTDTRDAAQSALRDTETLFEHLAGPTRVRYLEELTRQDQLIDTNMKEIARRQQMLEDRRVKLEELLHKINDLSKLEEDYTVQIGSLDGDQQQYLESKVQLEVVVDQLRRQSTKKSRHYELLQEESAPLFVNHTNRLIILKKELELHEREKHIHETIMLNELKTRKAKEDALKAIQAQVEVEQAKYDTIADQTNTLNLEKLADLEASERAKAAISSMQSLTDREIMQRNHFTEIRQKEVLELESRIRMAEASLQLESNLSVEADAELLAAHSLNAQMAVTHRAKLDDLRIGLSMKARELQGKAERKELEKGTIEYATTALHTQVAEAAEQLRMAQNGNAYLKEQIEQASNETFHAMTATTLRAKELEAEKKAAVDLAKLPPYLRSQLAQITELRRQGEAEIEQKINIGLVKQKELMLSITESEAQHVARMMNQAERGVQVGVEDSEDLAQAASLRLPVRLKEKGTTQSVLFPSARVLERMVRREEKKAAALAARKPSTARSSPTPSRTAATTPSGPRASTLKIHIVPTQLQPGEMKHSSRARSPRSPAVNVPLARPRSHHDRTEAEPSPLHRSPSDSAFMDPRLVRHLEAELEAGSDEDEEELESPSVELTAVASGTFTESLEEIEGADEQYLYYWLDDNGEGDILLQPGDELIEEEIEWPKRDSRPTSSHERTPSPTPRQLSRRFIRRDASKAHAAPPIQLSVLSSTDQPRPLRPSSGRVKVHRFHPSFFDAAKSSAPSAPSKHAPGSLLQGDHPDILAVDTQPIPRPRVQFSQDEDRPLGEKIEPMMRRIRFLTEAQAAALTSDIAATGTDLSGIPLRPYYVVAKTPSPRGLRGVVTHQKASTSRPPQAPRAPQSRRPSVLATQQPMPKLSSLLREQAAARMQLLIEMNAASGSATQEVPASTEATEAQPEVTTPNVAGHLVARFEVRHAEWARRKAEREAQREERKQKRAEALESGELETFLALTSSPTTSESEPHLSSEEEEDELEQLLMPTWKKEFSAADAMRYARLPGSSGPLADDESSDGRVPNFSVNRPLQRRESVREMVEHAEQDLKARAERESSRADKRAMRRKNSLSRSWADKPDFASMDGPAKVAAVQQWATAWASHEVRMKELADRGLSPTPEDLDHESMLLTLKEEATIAEEQQDEVDEEPRLDETDSSTTTSDDSEDEDVDAHSPTVDGAPRRQPKLKVKPVKTRTKSGTVVPPPPPSSERPVHRRKVSNISISSINTPRSSKPTHERKPSSMDKRAVATPPAGKKRTKKDGAVARVLTAAGLPVDDGDDDSETMDSPREVVLSSDSELHTDGTETPGSAGPKTFSYQPHRRVPSKVPVHFRQPSRDSTPRDSPPPPFARKDGHTRRPSSIDSRPAQPASGILKAVATPTNAVKPLATPSSASTTDPAPPSEPSSRSVQFASDPSIARMDISAWGSGTPIEGGSSSQIGLPPSFKQPVVSQATHASTMADQRPKYKLKSRPTTQHFLNRLEKAAAKLASSTVIGRTARKAPAATRTATELATAQSVGSAMNAVATQPRSPVFPALASASQRSPSHSPPRPTRKSFSKPGVAVPPLRLSSEDAPSVLQPQPPSGRQHPGRERPAHSSEPIAHLPFEQRPAAIILFDEPFFERAHASAVGEVAKEAAHMQAVLIAMQVASMPPRPSATAPSRPRSRARSRSQSRSQSRAQSRAQLHDLTDDDENGTDAPVVWNAWKPSSQATSPSRGIASAVPPETTGSWVAGTPSDTLDSAPLPVPLPPQTAAREVGANEWLMSDGTIILGSQSARITAKPPLHSFSGASTSRPGSRPVSRPGTSSNLGRPPLGQQTLAVRRAFTASRVPSFVRRQLQDRPDDE